MAYSTRVDVEEIFGIKNVAQWADLDNDRNETDIASRITKGIAVSDAFINNRFRRTRYRIPVVCSTSPETLVDIAAKLAGVWLYENRGIRDVDPDSGNPKHALMWHKKEANRLLDQIISGAIELDAPQVSEAKIKVVVHDIDT